MTLPVVRRQIVVSADPEAAYRAWIDDIGAWWPLERHSVFKGSTVAFDGDRIVETAPSGEHAVWGTVTSSVPPHRLAFTWHPGRDPDDRGSVELTFVPVADKLTLVTLEHHGWEHHEDPRASREEYRNGWPTVLERAALHLTDSDSDSEGDVEHVWLVLDHTAGLAADGPFWEHPLFPAHLEFLASLDTAGVLVAAGPLPDDPGHGQTIIRFPAADAARWVAAATADGAVRGELFELRVRPWAVQRSGV